MTAPWRTVQIGQLHVDDLVADEVDLQILNWVASEPREVRVVCTPNADYVVRARSDPVLREAVNTADLRVPDGMWIVYASRLAGRPLRGTVTGRLLLPRLARRCRDLGFSIGLFGAAPGVAATAADHLVGQIPGLEVRQAISPPMGLVVGSTQDLALVEGIRRDAPDLLFVALGAPRQEVWMRTHRPDLPGTVMIGVGAAFDIVAGRFREAPGWMTRLGIEWLFRLAQEPRRLARRYLLEDPWILWWAVRERARRLTQRSHTPEA